MQQYEWIFTTVIPAILVILIVVWNLRKIRKNLDQMKDQSTCSGSCKGCTHAESCSSIQKNEKKD